MLDQIITEYILIPIVHAETNGINSLIGRINEHIINPLILVLFALAFVQFVIGLFKFFGNKDSAEDIETGKRHMMWGIIGMAIMVSVFGIMSFLTTTLGINYNAQSNVGSQGEGNVSGLFQ